MNRFFAFIKRINTLLLILLLLFLAFALSKLWENYAGRRNGRTIAVVDSGNAEQKTVRMRLGRVERVSGQPVQLVYLLVEGDSRGFYSGSKAEDRRNVLFVPLEGKGRWLFPQHQQLLLNSEQLRLEEQPTQALLFSVINRDSDGDGRLSDEDKQDIVLCQPDGSGQVTALKEIDHLLSNELLSASKLSLLYQQNHALHQAIFALPSLKLQSEQRISSWPEKL